MFSAIFLRTPRNGTRSSPASACTGSGAYARAVAALPAAAAPPPLFAARTSSCVTRPFGPLARTDDRSTPRSRASLRVAGVASTLPLPARVIEITFDACALTLAGSALGVLSRNCRSSFACGDGALPLAAAPRAPRPRRSPP